MKCIRCGFEAQENFNICPVCRQQHTPVEVELVSINPTADKVMAAVKDGLFKTMCILMSIYCGLLILTGSFPIIPILATIFLWCTFSEAGKGFVSEKHLRNLSGTVYAGYILNNVSFVLLAGCGVLIGTVLSWAVNTTEFNTVVEILSALESAGIETGKIQEFSAFDGWVIGIAIVLISVIGLIINVLGLRKIHRFIKSVYKSVIYNTPNFINPNEAKNWLIFFGVCTAITAIGLFATGQFFFAIATVSAAVAQIVAAIIIKKYFITTENYI